MKKILFLTLFLIIFSFFLSGFFNKIDADYAACESHCKSGGYCLNDSGCPGGYGYCVGPKYEICQCYCCLISVFRCAVWFHMDPVCDLSCGGCQNNSNCPNKCEGGTTRYYNGSCNLSTCQCSYSVEVCSSAGCSGEMKYWNGNCNTADNSCTWSTYDCNLYNGCSGGYYKDYGCSSGTKDCYVQSSTCTTACCQAYQGANGACVGGVCTCVPVTCSSLGKNCGTWPNGCGGTLDCGSCGIIACTAPHTTGACAPICSVGHCSTCTPTCTCQTGWYDCNGDMSDGCESTSCATCSWSTGACGAGGCAANQRPQVCGPAGCSGGICTAGTVQCVADPSCSAPPPPPTCSWQTDSCCAVGLRGETCGPPGCSGGTCAAGATRCTLTDASCGGGGSFDFSISDNPVSGPAVQGDSVSATIITTLTSGTSQSVSFTASNLPAGASASFNPTNCNPSCNSTMTINTSATTPVGTYSINVCGRDGGQSHCVTYGLTVSSAGSAITSPTVTTNAATNITGDSATLNATLNNMGGAGSCWVWFEWGPTTSYGNTTSVQTLSSPGSFSANISGLSQSTTYYFKAHAKNGGSW
jgi:hypothetical protein